MIKQNDNQLFRLAAVLYADSNYEVSSKTIIRKIIECALLNNNNKPQTVHQLIDFISNTYSLNISEEEILSITTNKKEEYFLCNKKQDETFICLNQKRKVSLEEKLNSKTIDFFIDEFIALKPELTADKEVKEIIYRFLYELLSTNIESFKKLLDSKKQLDELINVESNAYTANEREIINEFLIWENNDKNKAIFDIASYALEYCMISNNGNGTHIQLSNLKNKVFYLDTNVIYRALGINGENRQKRTNTFLHKVLETGSTLIISKFSEFELKDSIAFYIDKLKKNPLNQPISPDIFNLKYFQNLSNIYDFYYKWRIGKVNDSLGLFENYIISLYENFKSTFKVETDYKVPFDEKDEKIEKQIKSLADNISSHKEADKTKHNSTGDYYDASNIILIETKREGKEKSIFETKLFFISTDQSLRRWDYYRNTVTPVVLLPSQWLSILLRFINRTNDDYKSFVSFLNLPSGESQIDSEKIHIVLRGISEMTSNTEQQRFLAQTMVQRKFEGILVNGIKEDELLERTKEFAQSELQKQIEGLEKKQGNLESELDTHKKTTGKKIDDLELKTSEQTQKLTAKEQEVERLKSALKIKTVNEYLERWERPAKWLILVGVVIVIFTVLQFCCKDWTYNYPYKIINAIDTLESETQKATLRTLMYAPLIGLWLICTFCVKRLTNSETKEEKKKEFERYFDETNK